MKSGICKSDNLESSSKVTGGSLWAEFMGTPPAREGDEAVRGQYGANTIGEHTEQFPDRDGKPFAMHHYHCECRLISSLQNINFVGSRKSDAVCEVPLELVCCFKV
jgi:hypothetical protein